MRVLVIPEPVMSEEDIKNKVVNIAWSAICLDYWVVAQAGNIRELPGKIVQEFISKKVVHKAEKIPLKWGKTPEDYLPRYEKGIKLNLIDGFVDAKENCEEYLLSVAAYNLREHILDFAPTGYIELLNVDEKLFAKSVRTWDFRVGL